MAQRYGLQIQERSAPAAFERNAVDGAATGVQVGHAMQGLGGAVQDMSAMLVVREDKQANYDAMAALRDYKRGMLDYLNNPDTGAFNTRKLGNARGLTGDVDKYANDLAISIRKGLSPRAVEKFDLIEQETRMPFITESSKFEAAQGREYEDMTFRSVLAENANTVAAMPYSAEVFDSAAREGVLAIEVRMQGAPESAVRLAQRGYVSGLEAGRIAKIAEENPILADELARESELLNDADRKKIQEVVKPELAKLEKAQRAEAIAKATDDLYSEFGQDEESARAAIYGSDLPVDTKDDLWQRYEARAQDEGRFEKDRKDAWISDMYGLIENAGSLEAALKMIDETGVAGEDRQKLLDIAKKVYPKTKEESMTEDPLIYAEVYEKISRGEITTAQELVAEYGDKFKPSTIKSLINKMVSGVISDEDSLVPDFSMKALKDIMDEADITEPADRANFLDTYSNEVLRQQEEKKRKLTPMEKESIARELTAGEIKKHEINWLPDKNVRYKGYQIKALENTGFEWDALTGVWVKYGTSGEVIAEVEHEDVDNFIGNSEKPDRTRNAAVTETAEGKKKPSAGDMHLVAEFNQFSNEEISSAMPAAMRNRDVVSQYGNTVSRAAEDFGVPEALVYAVMTQESGGRQNVVSKAGAIGLMQLMPATAKGLGVDPNDPHQNIRGGVKYLGNLLKKYGGNMGAALAHYNGGGRNAKAYLNNGKMAKETANYVPKVMALYRKYENVGG
ncbi:MAG: transglycosylase SLT domain-containing protein [Synergistaceae bacterium]|nr:transglycosylase SLT domain-containing protein [Synergistaceae bacterium]